MGPGDPRLANPYPGGPEDPAFRKDTLLERAKVLHVQSARALFFGEWNALCDVLTLHPNCQPHEAAERAMALLAPGGGGRPARSKELTAIAAWLGRDRESLKLLRQTPLEGIEAAFQQEWDERERQIRAGECGGGPPRRIESRARGPGRPAADRPGAHDPVAHRRRGRGRPGAAGRLFV